MSTYIILITHAVTQWHIKGKAQGHIDTPLNDYGNKMAELIADKLQDERIDAIYTSDLKRAYETAEPLSKLKNINIVKVMNMREGRWKVRDSGEYPLLAYHVDFESTQNLRKRIVEAITQIAKDNDDKRVFIVSHEGAIKQFIMHLKEISENPIPNYEGIRSSLNRFIYDNGKWTCISLNDGDFLKKVPFSSIKFFIIYLQLMVREKLTGVYVRVKRARRV